MLKRFIIDCYTDTYKVLIEKLLKVEQTKHIDFNGEYRQDKNLCQVIVETEMSEEELEKWLYNEEGIDYIGVAYVGD
jgi:hypothetical protein